MGLFDFFKKNKLLITPPILQGCEKTLTKILSNAIRSELFKECMSKKVDELIKNNFNTDFFIGSGRITTSETGLLSHCARQVIELNFIFSSNGLITNIKANGPNSVLEDEAIRVLGLMPKFKPATINGEMINKPYKTTILFWENDQLDEEGKINLKSNEVKLSSSTLDTSDLNGNKINENNEGVLENEPFWEVTETFVTLYKEGKEIAEGIAWDIFVNQWIEEAEDFQRESDHGEIILVDDKEFTDYDEIIWGEENEFEGNIKDYKVAEKLLYEVTGRGK